MPTSQVNGQAVATVGAGGLGDAGSRSELVHQPRAELARFQRARARRGARPVQPAARPAAVSGDLRIEPRRVLRGPRRRPAGPALREPRAARPAPRRHGAAGSAHRNHSPRPRLRRPDVRGLAHRDPSRGCSSMAFALCSPQELTPGQNAYLDEYFDTQVYPVLTPLAIDPAHPFPHVHNKSLNLLMRIESNEPHERKRLRRPPGAGGAQPPGPAARRSRRPAAVRAARRRDRPAARCPLRRLSHHRARGVSRHAQQRSDHPGERGHAAACCRRSRKRSASASGGRPCGWRSPSAPTKTSWSSCSRPRHSSSKIATSTRSPARST